MTCFDIRISFIRSDHIFFIQYLNLDFLEQECKQTWRFCYIGQHVMEFVDLCRDIVRRSDETPVDVQYDALDEMKPSTID